MNNNLISDIKYPLALNLSGNVVSAVTSPKKHQYTCIECATRMKLCGGNKQQSHFRHHTDTDRICSPESAIHKAGKLLLKLKIDTAIADNKPLNLISHCSECGEVVTNNLIEYVDRVVVEQSLFDGKCRPDLVGFKNGKPIIALEIVNTHYPEQQTLQILDANQVKVFVIKVESHDDLITKWQDNITGDWMQSSDDWWQDEWYFADCFQVSVIPNAFPLCKECATELAMQYHADQTWGTIEKYCQNPEGKIIEIDGEGLLIYRCYQDDTIRQLEYTSYDDFDNITDDYDIFKQWLDGVTSVGDIAPDYDYMYFNHDTSITIHQSPKELIKSFKRNNICPNIVARYFDLIKKDMTDAFYNSPVPELWEVSDFVNWQNTLPEGDAYIIEIENYGVFLSIDSINEDNINYYEYWHNWDEADITNHFAGTHYKNYDIDYCDKYTLNISCQQLVQMSDQGKVEIKKHRHIDNFMEYLASEENENKTFYANILNNIKTGEYNDILERRYLHQQYSRPNYD